MTGLNIQFLSLFEYDVIIWQVFIRMLGYYGSNAVGRIVKIFPLLGEEFIRGQEAQKARGQAGLEDRKVRRYEDRLFTVKSLSSYPPTLISSDNPLPQSLPQGREAEKCASRFTLHTSLKKQTAFTLAEGATHVVHFDDIRQAAFNLVKGNTHVAHFDKIRRAAFTLAEVLITLGIIGVVAAMTMPVLVGSYRKTVTETKLQKFYSIMNQAIKLAEVDYGEASMWVPQRGDDNGDFGVWYNTYLDKNIKSLSKNYYDLYYHVAFSDGSGFAAYIPKAPSDGTAMGPVRAYIFYCTDYKYCSMPTYEGTSGTTFDERNSYDGKHTFLFSICSDGRFAASGCVSADDNYYSRDVLLSGCADSDPHKRHLCTALIQHDGWKISKDYPWIK